MLELEAQAKFLAPVISDAIHRAMAPLTEQIRDLTSRLADAHKRLDDLPPLPEAAPEIDIDALAAAAAALVVVPAVDLDEVAARVQVPEPIPGRNADPVDLDALALSAAALVNVPTVRVDLEALAVAAARLIDVPAPAPAPVVDLDEVAARVQVPEVDLEAIAALVPRPEDGKSVPLEEVERMVAAEVEKRMALIRMPSDGEPGRDALDLEIMSHIDDTKSYPRNTYALHRGGLWKSHQRTEGMRGWECLVEGLDSVSVTQDHERQFSVILQKSSGATVLEKFSMPTMIYKGVWRPGDFEAGDTVTWAGSQWVCDEPTADKPGEPASKGWKLSVKKGRDAKAPVELPRKPEVLKL